MTFPEIQTSSSLPDGKQIGAFLDGSVDADNFYIGPTEYAVQLVDPLRDDAGSGVTSFEVHTRRSGDSDFIDNAELVISVNGEEIHREPVGTPRKNTWSKHKFSISKESFGASRTVIDGYVARPGATLTVDLVSNVDPEATATVSTTVPPDPRPEFRPNYSNTGPTVDDDPDGEQVEADDGSGSKLGMVAVVVVVIVLAVMLL